MFCLALQLLALLLVFLCASLDVTFQRDLAYEDGMTCNQWLESRAITKTAKLDFRDPTTPEECAQAVALDPECGGHIFHFCSANGIVRPRPACVCVKPGSTCQAESWFVGSEFESCKIYNNGTASSIPAVGQRPPPTQITDPQRGQAFWDRRLHLDHRKLHVLIQRQYTSIICKLAALYYNETGTVIVVHRVYVRDDVWPCREGDYRSCDWQIDESRVVSDEDCPPESRGLILTQTAWGIEPYNHEFVRRDLLYGSMGGMDLYYVNFPLYSHLDQFDETSLLEDLSPYLDISRIDWFSISPVNRQGFSNSGRGVISVPSSSPKMFMMMHDESFDTLNRVMTWEEYTTELERLSTIDHNGDGKPDKVICAYTWGPYRFWITTLVASSFLQASGLDENYMFDWKDTKMLLNSSAWHQAINITRRLVSMMSDCYTKDIKIAVLDKWSPKQKRRRTQVGSSSVYNRQTQALEPCSSATCPYALHSTTGALVNIASPLVVPTPSWHMNAKSLRKNASWSFIEFTQREDMRFKVLLEGREGYPWMQQDFNVSLWKQYDSLAPDVTPEEQEAKKAEFERLENSLNIGQALLFDSPLFNLHPYYRVGGPFWYQTSLYGLLGVTVDNAAHPDQTSWEEATQEMQVLNDHLYSLFGMLGSQTSQLLNVQGQILKLPTKRTEVSTETAAVGIPEQATLADNCLVGYHKAALLADFCFPCPKGFAALLPQATAKGAAACQMCPPGKYQGIPGSVRCQECRQGRTTLSSGAVTASECTESELNKAPLQYDLSAAPEMLGKSSVDIFWSLDGFHPPDQSTKEADVNIVVAMAWEDARLPEVLGPRTGPFSIAEWRDMGLWLPDFTVRGTTSREALEDFVEVNVSKVGHSKLVVCKRETSVRLRIDWPLLNWEMFPFGEQTLPIEARCEPADIACTCALCNGQGRRLQNTEVDYPQCAEDALRAQSLERRLAASASAGKVIAASMLSSGSSSASPVALIDLQYDGSTNLLTAAAEGAWPENWPFVEAFREDQSSGWPFRIIVRVKRESALSFIRTIIPAFLTCLLTMLVFLTDDLYNQLNLAFQCLLILAVYATEVSNSIPDHVTYLSWLDIYIFGNMILMAVLTFIAVAITVLDEKEKHKLGGALDRTTCIVMIPMVVIVNVGMILSEDLKSVKQFLWISSVCAFLVGCLIATLLYLKVAKPSGIYNHRSLFSAPFAQNKALTASEGNKIAPAILGEEAGAKLGEEAGAAEIEKRSQIDSEVEIEKLTQNQAMRKDQIYNLDDDHVTVQVQAMLSELLVKMESLEGKLEEKSKSKALTGTHGSNDDDPRTLHSAILELSGRIESFDKKFTMSNYAALLSEMVGKVERLEDRVHDTAMDHTASLNYPSGAPAHANVRPLNQNSEGASRGLVFRPSDQAPSSMQSRLPALPGDHTISRATEGSSNGVGAKDEPNQDNVRFDKESGRWLV